MDKLFLPNDLQKLNEYNAQIEIKKKLVLQKALQSSDPEEILKAHTYLASQEERNAPHVKSYLYDPFNFTNAMGYKDRSVSLSYDTLRQMAKVYVVRAVIETRKDHVARFATFTDDPQKEGWTIRKKKRPFMTDDDLKMTRQDKQRAREIAEFIQNCGSLDNKWSRDDFETFIRATVDDSLELDQLVYEVCHNRKGNIVEFFATDAATYRLADTSERYKNKEIQGGKVEGYYPQYVQIYQNQIVNEFYPWELCFAIRNKTTDIRQNGYGVSELEDLIRIITWILNSDEYNGRNFSNGSMPRGLLRVAGNVNPAMLNQLKQEWYAQVVGVQNSHRIPVIQAEKADWVDMQQKNREMEYSIWNQYLRVIVCALYKMDPQEVGFSQEGKQRSLFEANPQKKDTLSKEKGLIPLLRFWTAHFNKMVVSELDSNYEFVFCGVNLEDEQKQLENDIKSAGSFESLKEVRKRRGLPEMIDKDDIILNPVYLQYLQMQQMGNQESNAAMDQYTGDNEGNMYDQNPFDNIEQSTKDTINNYTEQLIKSLNEQQQTVEN